MSPAAGQSTACLAHYLGVMCIRGYDMKKELVEIYSDVSNYAVMRHPDRNFPGSLIQGDSLGILISEIQEAKEELASGNLDDVKGILEMLEERLQERMDVYNEALQGHSFD